MPCGLGAACREAAEEPASQLDLTSAGHGS